MMENPFENLRRERLAHEEKGRREREAQDNAKALIARKKKEAYDRYDNLVRDVLEQLRLAAYPNYQLEDSKGSIGNEEYISWSLGTYSVDGYSMYWNARVGIRLVFDPRWHPVGFACGREVTNDLSREGLIRLLQNEIAIVY
jgi:hypothetical protein